VKVSSYNDEVGGAGRLTARLSACLKPRDRIGDALSEPDLCVRSSFVDIGS
jgi:hypothetical protein